MHERRGLREHNHPNFRQSKQPLVQNLQDIKQPVRHVPCTPGAYQCTDGLQVNVHAVICAPGALHAW